MKALRGRHTSKYCATSGNQYVQLNDNARETVNSLSSDTGSTPLGSSNFWFLQLWIITLFETLSTKWILLTNLSDTLYSMLIHGCTVVERGEKYMYPSSYKNMHIYEVYCGRCEPRSEVRERRRRAWRYWPQADSASAVCSAHGLRSLLHHACTRHARRRTLKAMACASHRTPLLIY